MHGQLEPDRLYVTVDLLILTMLRGKLHLLLARRVNPPYEGLWALPGRFVELEESAETAAHRLLEEMLPLPEVFLEQLYTFTRVNRDPRGRVISAAYLAILPAGQALPERTPLYPFAAEEEAGRLLLKGGDGSVLRHGDLAFDHEEIIETGLARLRGKIDWTEIGFRFLENRHRFSLSELQSVHEAVLGKPLDASNFRRAVAGKYEKSGRMVPTDRTGTSGRGRPSVLYSLKD